MIIERDETLDWLKHFTGGIFCSPATLVVLHVAAWVMTLVCQLWHCQPSFRRFTVFLNFPQLSRILLCKFISNKMPSGIFISFFSLHTLGPVSVNTGGGWMLVEIPVDPGTNIPVTEMPWLPQSDAHHELQQVVSATSTCLSVLSYCHVIDWWAVCDSKYLNVFTQ